MVLPTVIATLKSLYYTGLCHRWLIGWIIDRQVRCGESHSGYEKWRSRTRNDAEKTQKKTRKDTGKTQKRHKKAALSRQKTGLKNCPHGSPRWKTRFRSSRTKVPVALIWSRPDLVGSINSQPSTSFDLLSSIFSCLPSIHLLSILWLDPLSSFFSPRRSPISSQNIRECEPAEARNANILC